MASNEASSPTTGQKKRMRSPNYPAISLVKAVELAQKQYEKDKMQKVPVHITFQRWGYKRGHGDICLAALKAYGLLEVTGIGDKREVCISEMARRILLQSEDSQSLTQKAALSPKIHGDLWQKYNGELPQPDVMRQYLLFDRNFNENAVDGFISQFLETISFAKLIKDAILDKEKHQIDSDDDRAKEETKDPPKLDESNVEKQKKMQQLSKQGDFRELRFWLPSGNAVLFVPEGMGAPDFEVLQTYIGAMRTASAAGFQTKEDSDDNG